MEKQAINFKRSQQAGAASPLPDGSALEHFSNELKHLRAPSPGVIAQSIRDSMSRQAQATRQEETRIASLNAGLAQAFYAFLALHSETEAFARLSAEKKRLLDAALSSRQETPDDHR